MTNVTRFADVAQVRSFDKNDPPSQVASGERASADVDFNPKGRPKSIWRQKQDARDEIRLAIVEMGGATVTRDVSARLPFAATVNDAASMPTDLTNDPDLVARPSNRFTLRVTQQFHDMAAPSPQPRASRIIVQMPQDVPESLWSRPNAYLEDLHDLDEPY